MRYIHEDLGSLFDGTDDRGDGSPSDSENYLLWKMHSFADQNLRWLERHPGTPLLYDTNVEYELPEQLATPITRRSKSQIAGILRREGRSEAKIAAALDFLDGIEEFVDTPRLYADGKGDCNKLVPTRLAELWRMGIPAKAAMIKKSSGGVDYYHAQIEHPPAPSIAEVDGIPQNSIEDPSVILGMNGMGDEMREAMRQNIERVQVMCGRAANTLQSVGGDGPAMGKWIQMCGFVPIMEDRLQKWLDFCGAKPPAWVR